MSRLPSEQLGGVGRIDAFLEQEREIEEIATLEPLEDAPEPLGGDLQARVGIHGHIREIRPPPPEQRAFLGIHDQLVIGDVELDRPPRTERPDVVDAERCPVERELRDSLPIAAG